MTKKLPWNLGDGIGNVCQSVMDKLNHADYQLESRERAIINLDSYEVTVLEWAMHKYMAERKENG